MKEQYIQLRDPGPGCILHFNPELEIVYVKKGCLEVGIGAQLWKVQSGHAIIVMPYFTHTFHSSAECEAVVMMFPQDIFHDFDHEHRGLIPQNYIFKVDASLKNYTNHLLNQLCEKNNKYIAEALFSAFICSYICDNSFTKNADSTQEILPKIVAYIFNNIESDIDLNVLSAQMGYSRRKLSHIFLKQTNMTLSAFINFLRIDRAKTLLRKTNLSITEIAEKCGFNSLRSFNRQFLTLTNTTPTDFKKERSKALYNGWS